MIAPSRDCSPASTSLILLSIVLSWSSKLHRLNYSGVCEIFLKSFLLHRQADSLPLSHQGSPCVQRILIVLGSYFGEGNGTPLQYSCLENPMDGGAWRAAVHGVAKSQTRLSNFTFTFHLHALEKQMATHSPVPGILQAKILEWVAISFSNACK